MEKWFLMWFIFSGPNPYDPATVVDGAEEFKTQTTCAFALADKDRQLKLMEEEDRTMSHMIFCQDLGWELRKELEEE